jgi:kynurenine formamidase
VTPLEKLTAMLGDGEWVDLTPTVENGMPRWPAHAPVVVHATVNHDHDGYLNQTLVMSEHSGAHVDAPAHSHRGRRTIDTFPPDFLVRPAKVVHWEDRGFQAGELATRADIEAWERASGLAIGTGDVVLFNFGWLARHWRVDDGWRWYAENMPGLAEEVADLLLERGVRGAGSDTIACGTAVVDGRSLGPAPEGCWLHRKLLAADVLLLECLANLERLPDEAMLFALPLPIKDGSGSPLRAAAFVPREQRAGGSRA